MGKYILITLSFLLLSCGKKDDFRKTFKPVYTREFDLSIGKVKHAFLERIVNGEQLIRINFIGVHYNNHENEFIDSQKDKSYLSNTGTRLESEAYMTSHLSNFTNNYKKYPNNWRTGNSEKTKGISEYFEIIDNHFDEWEERLVLFYEFKTIKWGGNLTPNNYGTSVYHVRRLVDFKTGETLAY